MSFVLYLWRKSPIKIVSKFSWNSQETHTYTSSIKSQFATAPFKHFYYNLIFWLTFESHTFSFELFVMGVVCTILKQIIVPFTVSSDNNDLCTDFGHSIYIFCKNYATSSGSSLLNLCSLLYFSWGLQWGEKVKFIKIFVTYFNFECMKIPRLMRWTLHLHKNCSQCHVKLEIFAKIQVTVDGEKFE